MLLTAALAAATAVVCTPDTTRRAGPTVGRDAGAFVPKGWSQESAWQPDLNGDGKLDRVVIVRDADNAARRIVAAISTAKGFRNAGEAALPGYPLGEASVEFNSRGVLVITDLTGGTTANQAVYRYRYEGPSAAAGAMRFIGFDVSRYSRTNQHDAIKLSFNHLTGSWSRQVDKLTRRGDYAPQKPVTGKGEPRCWFMEDTADPDDVISAEVPHGDDE